MKNIKTKISNWKHFGSQSIYTERYFGNLNFPEADKRKVFIFKHYNLYWIWRVGVIRQMSICKNWFPSLFLISALRCKRDHNLEEGSPVVSSSLYDISRRLTFEIWNIVKSTQLPQFVYKTLFRIYDSTKEYIFSSSLFHRADLQNY